MIEKLNGHIPDIVYNQLEHTCKKFNITNKLRLAHFISQCAHESGHFKVTKENLNYSAERLLVIFKKYFTKETAKEYEYKPDKIGSKVYANRMGNGDEASQEGYKYSGRGYIQLTGKDNYKTFDAFVSEDLMSTPGLVATKYPLMSAAFFFNNNNLWKICDMGSSVDVIVKLTKKINGGTIGIDDRIKLFNKYYKLLNTKNEENE
jgi:putative chitinase